MAKKQGSYFRDGRGFTNSKMLSLNEYLGHLGDKTNVKILRDVLKGTNIVRISRNTGLGTDELIRRIRNIVLFHARLKEDLYYYTLSRYYVFKKEFLETFPELEENVYYYLRLVYLLRQDSRQHAPLSQAVNDEKIPEGIRNRIADYVSKIPREVADLAISEDSESYILDYSVYYGLQKQSGILDFLLTYDRALKDISILRKEEAFYDINDLELQLLNRKDVLAAAGDTYIYYPFDKYNLADFFVKLDLRTYIGTTVSSGRIYRDHEDLMKEYQISDDVQLYSLLSKVSDQFWKDDEIEFLGRGLLKIGKVNPKKTVMILPSEEDTEDRSIVSHIAGDAKLIINEPNQVLIDQIHYYNDDTPWGILSDRITKEFLQVKILCEIDINDDEYLLLMDHLRNRYSAIVNIYRKPLFDIPLTVALVQLAIRNYNGNFWKHVAHVVGLEKLNPQYCGWIGSSATNTMKAYGKAIFREGENVANILMHAFIADYFINKYFHYIFQYYNVDAERNISASCENESQYICDCIVNPFSKRWHLLSDYVSLSVLCDREYCKSIVSQSLLSMDQSFWNEYGEGGLSGRWLKAFEQWTDIDENFKQKSREGRENSGARGSRQFRTPHLECDLNTVQFTIVLPPQMIQQTDEEDEIPAVFWKIISYDTRVISCEVYESYSGFKTKEILLPVERDDIFYAHRFELWANNELIRRFQWSAGKLQLFDENGHWVRIDSVRNDELYGFSRKDTYVQSRALLAVNVRNGLNFYEFQFTEGDFLTVQGESNYYIGSLPEIGLTEQNLIHGMSVVSDGKELPVYSEPPAMIIDVDNDQMEGTAVFINGEVNRLTSAQHLKIQVGRVSEQEFHYFSLAELRGLKEGTNFVNIDIPASHRTIQKDFFFLPEFGYEFIGGPYLFNKEAILRVECPVEEDGTLIGDCRGDGSITIPLADIKDTYYQFGLMLAGKNYKAVFNIPVFMYSLDGEHWSAGRLPDIWHKDLGSYMYIKSSTQVVQLGIYGNAEDLYYFTYRKNSRGYFICDLTKLKSYISSTRYVSKIYLLDGEKQTDILNVIAKSILLGASARADYRNDTLEIDCNIIGKNEYYIDVYDGEECIAEKRELIDGRVRLPIPDKSVNYLITVFESEDSDDFFDDVSYSRIDSHTVEFTSAKDLTGSAVRILHFFDSEKTYKIGDEFRYYMVITEKLSEGIYNGEIIRIFHGKDITYSAQVQITVPDLVEISTIAVVFYDREDHSLNSYYYDNVRFLLKEYENWNLSFKERKARYNPVLEPDSFFWKVEYIPRNIKLEKKGEAWRKAHPNNPREGSIWKK